jgi:hypothetical protein
MSHELVMKEINGEGNELDVVINQIFKDDIYIISIPVANAPEGRMLHDVKKGTVGPCSTRLLQN